MTVYVDDMNAPAAVPGARPAKWSHLLADSHAELERFARGLGLDPRWIQHAGTHREHYDVTMTVRERALRAGAVAITYPAGLADLLDRRRQQCQCRVLRDCTWAAVTAELEVTTEAKA